MSLVATMLSGCGRTGLPSAGVKSPLIPAGKQGVVHGGQQPVSGASIQLYAVGTSGDGSAATPLLSPAVTTDANGGFTITGLYTCPAASAEVYLVATGGNPGLNSGTSNTALALMAALGPCANLNANTDILLNELTTVAAVYSLAPYMASATAIGSGSSDTQALASAFALAPAFVNTASGSAPGTNVPAGAVVPTAQINLIGDILAACINSPGGVAGDGSACGSLFTLTTPATTAPANTIAAVLNLANNPTLNTPSLYNMASTTTPFQPTPASVPPDLVVSLMYPGGLTASASSLNFGTLTNGFASTAQTLTITNSGAEPVLIASFGVTGTNAADFAATFPSIYTTCQSPLFPGQTCSVSIQFTPGASGSRAAAVTITSNATNSTLTIPLGGEGVAPTTAGPITLSQNSLTFSQYGVFQPLTLSNLGNTTLLINRIAFTGTYKETDNCGTSLPAQSVCTINVAVSSSNTGRLSTSGVMTVIDDAAAGPQTANLTYTGAAQDGGDTFFGNWAIGAATTLSVTMINPSQTYNPQPMIQGANAVDFAAGPGNCLTGGGGVTFCTFQLTFHPVNYTAPNLRTATMTLPTGVSILTGIAEPAGTDFSITSSPNGIISLASFAFNSAYQGYLNVPELEAFLIKNTGTTSVTLTAPALSGPSAAQFTTNFGTYNYCGTGALAVGATCTLNVTLNPTQVGPLAANLTLADSTGAMTRTLQLSTTAIPMGPTASALNFPNTQVGSTSAPLTMTITSYNNDPFTVTPSFGNPAEFAFPQGTSCAQSPCQLPIVFTPSKTGAFQGYVQLYDSVYGQSSSGNLYGTGQNGYPAVTLSSTSLTFPLRTVGTTSVPQTVTLTNSGTGTAPLALSGISLTGTNTGDYILGSNTCGTSLATGANCSFTISFAPTAAGTRTATVQVLSNATTSPDTVALSGTAQ